MNQNGTMAGKLKGAIMANTPIGRRMTSPPIPGAAPTSLSPCCRTGLPHAGPTVSRVRAFSRRASGGASPSSVRGNGGILPQDARAGEWRRGRGVEGVPAARARGEHAAGGVDVGAAGITADEPDAPTGEGGEEG